MKVKEHQNPVSPLQFEADKQTEPFSGVVTEDQLHDTYWQFISDLEDWQGEGGRKEISPLSSITHMKSGL